MDNIEYNSNQDNANKNDTQDYVVVESIKKSEMPYLTKKDCRHENTEVDASEDTAYYYGIKCKDCPMGWLVKKTDG